jgi:hypothetical protein
MLRSFAVVASPEIKSREIFYAVRFSTFSTVSARFCRADRRPWCRPAAKQPRRLIVVEPVLNRHARCCLATRADQPTVASYLPGQHLVYTCW